MYEVNPLASAHYHVSILGIRHIANSCLFFDPPISGTSQIHQTSIGHYSSITNTMPTFDERVQALPPELYQEIYDLTFTPTSTEVFVTKEYQPPALLRINQATRKFLMNCGS